MYPTENTVVVPEFGDKPRPVTLDEVKRYGRVVALSADEATATIEVRVPGSPVVTYCGVCLDPSGVVTGFIPRRGCGRANRAVLGPVENVCPETCDPNVEEYRK